MITCIELWIIHNVSLMCIPSLSFCAGRVWPWRGLWSLHVWSGLSSDDRENDSQGDTQGHGEEIKILCQELCHCWPYVCWIRVHARECRCHSMGAWRIRIGAVSQLHLLLQVDWFSSCAYACLSTAFETSIITPFLSPPLPPFLPQYRGRSGLSTSTMAGCATGGVIGLRGEFQSHFSSFPPSLLPSLFSLLLPWSFPFPIWLSPLSYVQLGSRQQLLAVQGLLLFLQLLTTF